MKKLILSSTFLILALILFNGCGPIGDKSASLSMIYGTTTILSLLLLIGYSGMPYKKDVWLYLLFSSVAVVNIGYLTLSFSGTLEEALLANRIAYLGSVFLPMAMLMIILNTTWIRYPKWLSGLLLCIGIAVFLVAASPGYSTIYYKEVALEFRNGVSVLKKVYGPWHCLYLVYLLGYFLSMVTVILYAAARKKLDTPAHAVILATAVFVNIGVWLIEQLVELDFEILSVSYIISELFLLGLNMMLAENMRLKELVAAKSYVQDPGLENVSLPCDSPDTLSQAENAGDSIPEEPDHGMELFLLGLGELTQSERRIYDFYIEGKTTKEILAALNIKENTLKFHNKNLYSKLGVSSRKQLLERYKQIKQ